jgi:hypothetical protein
MNLGSVAIWGFVATVVQTTLEAGAQGLGLSRMSIPFILGTMFTPDRDKASLIGIGLHLLNGWLIALLYALIFESLGKASWWIGGILGLGHGFFILLAVLRLLPGFHPRMASEHTGPDPTRALEPPGFLALHYGRWTPITALIGHVAFGIVLGAFYQLLGA